MKRKLKNIISLLLLIIISCGGFLYSQNQKKTVSKEDIKKANRLIPMAVQGIDTVNNSLYLFSEKINTFFKNQDKFEDFEPTGLNKNIYLEVIENQVRAMLKYQNDSGRIIDPIEKKEKYYTTPCFAHSVAVLVSSGKIKKTDPLLKSGIKALSRSIDDMVNDKVNGNHGDFYTWPVMLAYENFKPFVSKDILKSWKKGLKVFDISKVYEFYNREHAINWILVHASGEFLRAKNKFTSFEYGERMMGFQLANFTKEGLYNEGGNPLAYDLFARHYLAGTLQLGYNGKHLQVLRDNLWKGAWTSLLIQSPFGELPTGYRSSHHIWNEAEQSVLFEIYASAYADLGRNKEAGVFKRAAMLSLNTIKKWIREDGSGYIVKNRFPIENKHGYERYSVHTCYNMLAMSMLAQAWQFSDDTIKELPTPADQGGFVIPIIDSFHKIFANHNGTYVEYETKGDQTYNPTGFVRAHIKGSNPQLGPSNGLAPYFSGEGINIATGPSWKKADGTWTSLAEIKVNKPKLEILEETLEAVRFKLTYDISEGDTSKKATVSETFLIKDGVISVSNEFKGIKGTKRITWPMLISDGKETTKVDIKSSKISLGLAGKNIQFTVLDPNGVSITQSEKSYAHVNGKASIAYISFSGDKITYTLSSK